MDGKVLRTLRESKGLLQKELASKLDTSTSTIGMYEQNRREPDNTMLKKIANFFHVSTDYLLDNVTPKSEEEEIEVLKQLLIRNNYMTKDEEFTYQEYQNIMKLINNNKEFLKK